LHSWSSQEVEINNKIVLTSEEDAWIIAECPEMPGCVSQGKTEAEAIVNIREAISGWLWAESLKASDPPTTPRA
jgi:predicted RNase H-like HicB family nuclease